MLCGQVKQFSFLFLFKNILTDKFLLFKDKSFFNELMLLELGVLRPEPFGHAVASRGRWCMAKTMLIVGEAVATG